MNNAEDAVAIFQARGFYAQSMPLLGEGHFVVGVQPELSPTASVPTDTYTVDNIRWVRCYHAFTLGEAWSVRAEDMTVRQFASLDDAVNAVLARLEAWVAEHPS